MVIRQVLPQEKNIYDSLVNHPLQSWAWGEARLATGVDIVRLGIFENQNMSKAFMLTVHPIPKINKNILYCPRGPIPDEQITSALNNQARDINAVFIKIEPDYFTPISTNNGQPSELQQIQTQLLRLGYKHGRSLFTPYNFIIDLTQTEQQLLANMKPKTRYNINLAQKKIVTIQEDNSEQAFNRYLELTAETTSRQKFYSHSVKYHQAIWQQMHSAGIAHLLTASYQEKILATWILYKWKNTLYYPYGASSIENKEVMANNLMMWEAIKFGKQLGCTTFDLWGTAGLNPTPEDNWYGFHKFKEGYSPQIVQYIGTYDYAINTVLYPIVIQFDKLRHLWLRLKASVNPNSFS